MSNGMIFIESGVSAFTSEPFITLAWGDERGQLTVAEARCIVSWRGCERRKP